MHGSHRAILTLLVALAMTACGRNDGIVRPTPGGSAPDFALADVNPKSARTGEIVSPRDYLQRVSAWYFGHAT